MTLINKINELKLRIYELEEYLHSESCRECYETVMKLEETKAQLQSIYNSILTDDS